MSRRFLFLFVIFGKFKIQYTLNNFLLSLIAPSIALAKATIEYACGMSLAEIRDDTSGNEQVKQLMDDYLLLCPYYSQPRCPASCSPLFFATIFVTFTLVLAWGRDMLYRTG